MSRVRASRQHRMVVVRHRPVLKWSLILGSLIASVMGAWAAFHYGQYVGAKGLGELAKETEEQHLTITELESQKNACQQELTNLNTGLEIDQKANESIRQQLMDLRTTLENVQAENEMYRNILDPDNVADKKPALERWSMNATGIEKQYAFQVIAKQLTHSSEWTKGAITLKINGLQNGVKKTLDYRNIAVGDKTLPVKFRYFQTISGAFELPSEFAPEEITLELKINGKKTETATLTVPWPL